MSWSDYPLRTLVIPQDAADGSAHTVIDGDTGDITLYGADGSKIVITANSQPQPTIMFVSPDGTNTAYINTIPFDKGNVADLGINGGKFTPADGVPRRTRLYFNGRNGVCVLETIDEATQVRHGGALLITPTNAFIEYKDPTIDNYMRVDKFGVATSAQIRVDGEVWQNITYQNGWGGTVKVMKLPIGGMVWINGAFGPVGTKANGTQIGTLPPGFIPSQGQDVLCSNNYVTAGDESPHLGLQPSGAILTRGNANATWVGINAFYQL